MEPRDGPGFRSRKLRQYRFDFLAYRKVQAWQ
jgi:hypothetical protein